MIKGAIFDVDGTLLDSMDMWIHFGENYLRSKGITVGHEFDIKIQYYSLREVAEEIAEGFPVGMTADEVEEDCERVTREFYFEKALLKEGVLDLVRTLYEKGVRMYIATATYSALIVPCLERLGIMKYFEGIVTCSDVGHGKDCPHIFLEALKRIETPINETWVFEDALHAVKTAKAMGLSVCGIYDPTEKGNREILEDLCDIYVDDPGKVDVAALI